MDTPPCERSLETWPDVLQHAAAATTHFHTVRVLRETATTQDAAQHLALPIGSLLTAGRQSAGRGRLGSAWADTASDGIAATFVVHPEQPERLAMAAAVAVALAARASLPLEAAARLGLKWPNDLLAAWPGASPRKVAGVLVEIRDTRALIGIGINVRQQHFAPPLATRAASLHMLGGTLDRLATLTHLMHHLDEALSHPPHLLESIYRELDRTAGLRLTFITPQGIVQGVVMHCDPSRGLKIICESGGKWLPAATTRVQPDTPLDRSTTTLQH